MSGKQGKHKPNEVGCMLRWNGSRWEPVLAKPVLERHPRADEFQRRQEKKS